ncbi:hypothetical protein ABII15_12725 [Streptomyces sp. HUAS MG91]|uniref:Alpha/beta hydrolase n=1 Tax=Streptomyces tabacisoli TaxID=3156398 RepID=A0AAU8IQW6_9ACTN
MKRLRVCLPARAALIASSPFLDAHPSATASRNESTHSYGTHTRQELDTYWNRPNSSHPGTIFLHGGSWHENSEWATWPHHFADQVDTVPAVGCRLTFDGSWPASRTDAISAIAWIRDNVAKLDLHPQRLAPLPTAGVTVEAHAYLTGGQLT